MTHEQEQLILNNLDYAKALHHKFCNEHEISDRDDYLQQANLGLVEASLKYKKGSAKFTTFAYYSMENNMSRFLKRNKVNLEYNNDITGRSSDHGGIKRRYFERGRDHQCGHA